MSIMHQCKRKSNEAIASLGVCLARLDNATLLVLMLELTNMLVMAAQTVENLVTHLPEENSLDFSSWKKILTGRCGLHDSENRRIVVEITKLRFFRELSVLMFGCSATSGTTVVIVFQRFISLMET